MPSTKLYKEGEFFRSKRDIYNKFNQLQDKDRDALADELDAANKYWMLWEIVAKYSKILYTDYGIAFKACYGDKNKV